MKLSDILMASVLLISLIVTFTFETIFSIVFLGIVYWGIVFYYFMLFPMPLIFAKMQKCPYCKSKSTRFFDWDESLKGFVGSVINPTASFDYLTGKFQIKCDRCKKIFDADNRTRFAFSISHIIGLFLMPIYFILLFVYSSPLFFSDLYSLAARLTILMPILASNLLYVYFRKVVR
jgi:phage FluMu protein Com